MPQAPARSAPPKLAVDRARQLARQLRNLERVLTNDASERRAQPGPAAERKTPCQLAITRIDPTRVAPASSPSSSGHWRSPSAKRRSRSARKDALSPSDGHTPAMYRPPSVGLARKAKSPRRPRRRRGSRSATPSK